MTSRSSHGESRRETIRVLHVDDEPDLTDLTATLLQREDDRIVVDTATSASDGLSRLAEDTFDCVVSDYEMPGKNGIEFLEAVREEYPGLPFMLFTGRGSEEVASEAISAGVTDYLQKGRDTSQYTVLANRVSNAVEQYRAKREAAATRQRLSIFFEQSPLGAIEWTDDFECLRLNETATEILGYSEDDLVGESWKSVVAEPFHEQFSDVVADPLTADAGLHDTTTEVVTQDGERIVCEWHHRVVTNDDGELITIFSKFQDITDEYRRQQRRERQQNTLIDLATEDAVATGDFETAVQRITETAADVLDVPRVNVWLIEEDDQEGTLSCVDHYERPADTHDRHMELDLDDYPAYFEALKTHRAIGVSDAQEDPRTAELADYLETQDIGALLDATLWSGGDVVGVVCHEHVDGTREWTDDELDFASDIADIIYRALQNRERRRQRQELELKDRAMDAAPAGITITDPARDDNPLIYVNERFERLTGYSAEEILGQNCRFLQGKNTDPGPVARLREAIDAAEPVSVELRNYREDGTEFWNRVSIAPVRTNGEVTNYVGFQQDITEEKERAAELQRKERRYQAVFNDPNILVGLLDTDGTVLDINETAMNYVDATPDEIVDRPFPETPWFDHSEAVQEEVEEWIDRAASGEYVDFEVELIHSSGTPYTVEGVFRPVTDEDGNVVSLLISDRDITEQKEHERALEQTNTLLSTLFETLPVGILAEDEHRNVLAANKRLFELFEVSELPDDIVGEDCEQMARDMSEMFVDPDDFVTGVEKRISDHSPADGDELVLRDGRTFERSYRPLDLPDGGGHVWVYRDITDRERHEQTVTALHETAEEIHRADTDQQVVEVMVDAVAGLLDMPLNGVALHDGAENVLRLAALTEEVEELFGALP
ncbi:MAG: PAS domain S-box-containing protein, partial [Natronomonas sp.]